MKKIVGCVAFLLVITLGILELNRVLKPKWDYDLFATYVCDGFYAEDSLDVVFVGTSQVLYGITPMELYEEYGIKAYDCATGAQSYVVSHYWAKEAIERTHPKVVVIEIYDLAFDDLSGEESIRQSLDYMRFGKNKIDASRDVINLYDIDSDFTSFLLPAVRYHSRWQELEKKDFTYQLKDKSYYTKGYIGGTDVYAFSYAGVDFETIPDMWEDTFLTDYLRETLEYCKETDTKVLLTKVPIAGYNYAMHNKVQQIADEYEVPFIDMVSDKDWAAAGIDSNTDFIGLPHLNFSGAIKTTRYLGEFLVNEYPEVLENSDENLKDERWQKELKEYQKYRQDGLKEIERNAQAN